MLLLLLWLKKKTKNHKTAKSGRLQQLKATDTNKTKGKLSNTSQSIFNGELSSLMQETDGVALKVDKSARFVALHQFLGSVCSLCVLPVAVSALCASLLLLHCCVLRCVRFLFVGSSQKPAGTRMAQSACIETIRGGWLTLATALPPPLAQLRPTVPLAFRPIHRLHSLLGQRPLSVASLTFAQQRRTWRQRPTAYIPHPSDQQTTVLRDHSSPSLQPVPA